MRLYARKTRFKSLSTFTVDYSGNSVAVPLRFVRSVSLCSVMSFRVVLT